MTDLGALYAGSTRGQSVRLLDLAYKTAGEIHATLLRSGFRSMKLPIPAISWKGERRFLLTDGSATEDIGDKRVVVELLYLHDDGGIVRVFPTGLPGVGLGLDGPCARKSVAAAPVPPTSLAARRDLGLAIEAFAVSPAGEPFPKSPLVADGLRAVGDELGQRKVAYEALAAVRIPIAKGPFVPWPVDRTAGGIFVSRTIVPRVRFSDVMPLVTRAADRFQGPLIRKERGGETQYFFPGHQTIPFEAIGLCRGLASVTVLNGQYTIRIDPIGTPISLRHLASFVEPLRASFPHMVIDDATGRDITTVVARYPSALLSVREPLPVVEV